MEKNEGKKITLTTYILSLIIMALISGILIYLVATDVIGNNDGKENVVAVEKEETKIESPIEETSKETLKNEETLTEKENNEIKEYIEKIYPIPSGTYNLVLEEFDSVKNANQEWIWSTAIKECSTESKAYSAKLSEIEKAAKELYGNKIERFPVNDYEDINIFKSNNDEYMWVGNQASIPEVGQYRIKSINKENGLYKVEIAQCIVYDWADGVKVLDVNGNILKVIAESQELSDNYEKDINDYIDNNINKLDKKELTIEYDEDNMQYHIISIKNK